jgi:hypothetical protein
MFIETTAATARVVALSVQVECAHISGECLVRLVLCLDEGGSLVFKRVSAMSAGTFKLLAQLQRTAGVM